MQTKRVGIKLDAVREYSAIHGIELDGALLDRIEICEAWQLKRDAELAPVPPNDEEEERPEAVN
jgi:hypothetical protein